MIRSRIIYITLFVLSITGLFVIQYQYLRIGLRLAQVQFSQKIASANDLILQDLATENQLTFLLLQSLSKDDSYFKLSIDSVQDASSHYLDDFIRNRLVKNGIEKEYDFSLYTRDSLYYLHSPKTLESKGSQVNYPIELKGFLPDSLNRDLILELHFNDLNSYFISQLNGMIIPSIIFILIIAICIVWIIRSYLSQRNLITRTNEFINNFTHELKTPVFSIGIASKILETDLPEDKKPVFEVIRKQTDRLKAHIDKILELSKLESSNELFVFKEFDLEPSLKRLCDDFGSLLEMEGGNFNYELSGGPYPVNGVVNYIENAILNVLDNSRKYSRLPEIALKAFQKDRKVHIQISDNGPGIRKEDLERVFQKHVRVVRKEHQNIPGYGLGLSYVKEIIKKHRGTVEVKSEVNSGTTVTLILPLKHG